MGPRLLIYTGARLKEICQLRPQDVITEQGIPLLVIHDAGERQSIKNTASIRKVPLHPAVQRSWLTPRRLATVTGSS